MAFVQNPHVPDVQWSHTAIAKTDTVIANMYPYSYRRMLPHFQKDNRPIFITFATYHRWLLPLAMRKVALECCLGENGYGAQLHAAVVMPDHAHLILTPLADHNNCTIPVAEIMRRIKGRSARNINLLMSRKGSVWQEESFDHVLRTTESLEAKIDYIAQNPVRAGLIRNGEEYPYLWIQAIPAV
jgi:REP element-mobilizing transposase RayT